MNPLDCLVAGVELGVTSFIVLVFKKSELVAYFFCTSTNPAAKKTTYKLRTSYLYIYARNVKIFG